MKMRELWDPPAGPPERPAGVPARPIWRPGETWLEWINGEEGHPTRWVWAWIKGEWVAGSVSAEGRTPEGWWFHVWLRGGPVWVHEAATRPWSPTPEEIAESRRIMRRPELSRDEILALIQEEFGQP